MSDEQVNPGIAANIKQFFEEALRTGATSFVMADLLAYVQACTEGEPTDTISQVLSQLKERGEINYVCVNRSKSQYLVAPPHAAQSTMFGADSNPATKPKAKPFSKKAKQAAFDALNEKLPLDPRLERLYDWLYEQIQ